MDSNGRGGMMTPLFSVVEEKKSCICEYKRKNRFDTDILAKLPATQDQRLDNWNMQHD